MNATLPNKGMKQTSVEHIGRSQLIPGVGQTLVWRAMANAPASRRATVLRLSALVCACLPSPVAAHATSCVVEMVTLARVPGRVRYVARPDTADRVAVGVRVEIITMGAREPKVVAAVETDAEGRFAFKALKAGRPYVVSFKASDAYGLVNVRLDPSFPHTWLTMVLDDVSDRPCPANRATVGKPD